MTARSFLPIRSQREGPQKRKGEGTGHCTKRRSKPVEVTCIRDSANKMSAIIVVVLRGRTPSNTASHHKSRGPEIRHEKGRWCRT